MAHYLKLSQDPIQFWWKYLTVNSLLKKTQDFWFRDKKRVKDNFTDWKFEESFSFNFLPFDHLHDSFLQFAQQSFEFPLF